MSLLLHIILACVSMGGCGICSFQLIKPQMYRNNRVVGASSDFSGVYVWDIILGRVEY
jgi:predicted AlkP superfamily phosphohydrolase/phosphomutase